MDIKFIFDEGISHDFSKGLKLTGKKVEHVLDTFDQGTDDEVWLKYAGENDLVLITKDKAIRRKPNEKALLLKHGIVAFYLGGSEKSGQDILKQLVNAWDKMEAKAKVQLKKGNAGAFRIPLHGTGKLIDIPLS